MRRRLLGVLLIVMIFILSAGNCLALEYDGGYDGDKPVGANDNSTVQNGLHVVYGHTSLADATAQFRSESLWGKGDFSKNGLSYGRVQRINSITFVFFDDNPNKDTALLPLDKMAKSYGFTSSLDAWKSKHSSVPFMIGIYYRVYEKDSGKMVYPISDNSYKRAFHPLLYYGGSNCSSADIQKVSGLVSNAVLIGGFSDGIEYVFEYSFLLADLNGQCDSLASIKSAPGSSIFSCTFSLKRDGKEKGLFKCCRIFLDGNGKVVISDSPAEHSLLDEASDKYNSLTGVPYEDTNPINYIEAHRQDAVRNAGKNDFNKDIAGYFQLMRLISIIICTFGIMIAIIRCSLPGYQGPFLLRFKAALGGWVILVISIGAAGTLLSFFVSFAFGL